MLKCFLSGKKAVLVYFLVSVISVVVWIPWPTVSYFFRANSTILTFLTAASAEEKWGLYAALVWIVVFVCFFSTGCVLAVRRAVFLPFLVAAGLDWLISLCVLLCNVHTIRSMGAVFVGLILHGFHYGYTVFCAVREY